MPFLRRARIYDRNKRVTFYRRTITGQNASGEDVYLNVTLGSAWVEIKALDGKEIEKGQQLKAEARFRIDMDHPLSQYTLRRADRITWGSRTLDILDVEDPTGLRRQLTILAKEFTE